MDGERVVFAEENDPQNYVKIIASGAVDYALLEALEGYVSRQRKRLSAPLAAAKIEHLQMRAFAGNLPG
jgi:hypothetical protein